MSNDFFKIKKGLNIKPQDPSSLTDLQDGDIIVDSTDDNRLKVYNSVSRDFASVGTGRFNAIDTKANLDALAREQGKIYYATDEDLVYTDDGTQLNVLGGGGGGIPNLTKGGLVTSDGSNNGELTVGTDGQVLVADSAEPAGIKWFDIIPTGGTTGQVLTKTATGYEWQDASGGGMQLITTRRQSVTTFNNTSYTIPANTYGIVNGVISNGPNGTENFHAPAGSVCQVSNGSSFPSSFTIDGNLIRSTNNSAATQYLYVMVIGN